MGLCCIHKPLPVNSRFKEILLLNNKRSLIMDNELTPWIKQNPVLDKSTILDNKCISYILEYKGMHYIKPLLLEIATRSFAATTPLYQDNKCIPRK